MAIITKSARSLWNYGLLNVKDEELQTMFKVSVKSAVANYPWTLKDAPVEIKVPAKVLEQWQLYQEAAGSMPYSIQGTTRKHPVQEITLVPYGCTTLRISEFPEVR